VKLVSVSLHKCITWNRIPVLTAEAWRTRTSFIQLFKRTSYLWTSCKHYLCRPENNFCYHSQFSCQFLCWCFYYFKLSLFRCWTRWNQDRWQFHQIPKAGFILVNRSCCEHFEWYISVGNRATHVYPSHSHSITVCSIFCLCSREFLGRRQTIHLPSLPVCTSN